MHVPPIYTVSQCYKKAVRLVFGASRLDHTSMLFYRCRVLRFKQLVKLKMCSILYKVYYNIPVSAHVSFLLTHIYVLLDFSANMYIKVAVLILRHDAYKF